VKEGREDDIDKKHGWLKWFLAAGAAVGTGGVPMHMDDSSTSMGIRREGMLESRRSDDW